MHSYVVATLYTYNYVCFNIVAKITGQNLIFLPVSLLMIKGMLALH